MPLIETNDDDDVEIVPLALPLDRGTVAWLARLADGDDAKAAEMIASIVREVREEDELAHKVLH